MASCANKQYVCKIAELYELKLERSHREQSLIIRKKDNEILFMCKQAGPPEVVWENIWRDARIAIEIYTGINYFYGYWRDL